LSQLVILSGPPNAGKSATAEALCQRYDRMLHVDVSALRDAIRMGRLRPWDDSPAGRAQRELLVASACDTARRFLDAGYGVIVGDIALPEHVSLYRDALAGISHEAHFVVLLPALDVVLDRERQRPTEWHRAGRLETVYKRFASWTGVAQIDPDDLAPELVADRVMALAAEGRALLSDAS
jgi:hypothetical protein